MKEFLQQTPFFRLLLPLIIGILLHEYLSNDIPIYLVITFGIAGVGLMILSVSIKDNENQYKLRWIFGLALTLVLCCSGFFLSSEKNRQNNFCRIGERGIFKVELLTAPIEKNKSVVCNVKLLQYLDASQWKPAEGNARIFIQKDENSKKLLHGDQLLIQTEFNRPEKALNPNGFDEANYLKRQSIAATAYAASGRWKKISFNKAFSILRTANKCRDFLLDIYRKFGIKNDEFAVLAALTLGYTDELKPDLRKSYNATGAVHILSVSGLHVGIVYAAIAFLLSFLRKNPSRRIIRSILIILSLWAYAVITGLSPSVVRSAFMFSFVAIASCLERRSQIYNTIFMSAFFMLLINPFFLFQIGFQLSFSAVLSIVFFFVPAYKVMKTQNRVLHWLWDLFSVSIAAQIGTLPFILYYFHQFPVYFLLTNLIAIPLSTLIIYMAIVLIGLSFIPAIPFAIAFLLNILLTALNTGIIFIQNLPFSVVSTAINAQQMLLLITSIICITAFYFTKRYLVLMMALSAFLLIGILNLHIHYQTFNSKKMLVYAGQKHTHVSFINGYSNSVFTEDQAEIERIATSYWQNNKLYLPTYLTENEWFSEGFAYFGGKRIAILSDNFLKGKYCSQSLELDYLIIGRHAKPKMQQILNCLKPRNIIIDKGVSKWYTEHIKESCEKNQISYYSVAEEGAFIINFEK